MMTKVDVKEALKDELSSLYPLGGFRPLAYYDKHLDCIRVQIKDCSFTEVRMNNVFTLWNANHSTGHIGFSIKGVKHLFNTLGFSETAPIQLAHLIDAIVQLYPEQTIKEAVSQIRKTGLKTSLDMEIDLKAA